MNSQKVVKFKQKQDRNKLDKAERKAHYKARKLKQSKRYQWIA